MLFISVSCKETATEIEKKEFLNTLWVLESFDVDGDLIITPNNQIYNIQFFADSTFIGTNHCNDINGSYQINENNSLKFNVVGTTFANCGEKSLYKDFYEALLHVNSYVLDGN